MRFVASLFAGVALTCGCGPTHEARDPSYAGWGRLERLAVAEPVLCAGESVEAYVALDALKSQVAMTAGAWTAGKPSCAGLREERTFDPDDLTAPALGTGQLAGLDFGGADALLVTTVSIDETCDAHRACSANVMNLAAFLYDASGRMVWKSVTSRPLGFGFPAPSAAEPRQLLYARPRHPDERVVATR